MLNGRLVKVALPGPLVSEMDDHITASTAYAGRTDFITDAVANLLADLRVSSEVLKSDQPDQLSAAPAPQATFEAVPTELPVPQRPLRKLVSYEYGLAIAEIIQPNSAAPRRLLTSGSHEPRSEPTWGMHNRDWPTIWAASVLGVLTSSGPIGYDVYIEELLTQAWDIGSVLKDDWDLSGLPGNAAKAVASEARFIEFFVGSQLGDGPLFSFGLAAADGSEEVVLTDGGVQLLGQLAGMTRKKGQTVSRTHRVAFLRHLSLYGPADVEMLCEVVSHISDGSSTRTDLIDAIQSAHPGWPAGTAATNAAGYVARAREWGVINPKQVNHQYIVESDGRADLDETQSAVAGKESK